MRTPTLHPVNNFDALRILAAFGVLFSHMFAAMGLPELSPMPNLSFGTLCVWVFFAISGYLVTQSWHNDPHALRFMARRLLRLWPALLVSVIITLFIITPLVMAQTPLQLWDDPDYRRYLRNLVFVLQYKTFLAFEGTGLPNPNLNTSPWTIPFEFICYVLFMLIAVVCRRYLRFGVPLMLAGLLCYFMAFGGQDIVHASPRPPRWHSLTTFAVPFFTGSLLYLYPFLLRSWVLYATCFSGLLLVFFTPWSVLGLGLFIPSIVIAIGLQSWPYIRHAGRFGDLSYGAYLYAWPIQQLTLLALGLTAPFLLVLAISTLCAALAGYLSWHGVEAPALRFKPRSSHKR